MENSKEKIDRLLQFLLIIRVVRIAHTGYVSMSNGCGGYNLIHRLVIENYLGRKLKSRDIVHHKDGNKLNNRLENLEVMTQSRHVNIHRQDLLAGRGYGK